MQKDLIELVICIYQDAADLTTVKIPVDERNLDIRTMVKRIEDEGISFLTITLPQLGADLEQCLSRSCIDSQYFRNFRKYRKVPAFMRGFFSQVFDAGTGRILDDPCSLSIDCIRQVAYACKKIKDLCSEARIEKAYAGFIQDEHDLGTPIDYDDSAYFCAISEVLWGATLCDFDHDRVVPKHGPGATAEKLTGNRKYSAVRWHSRLEGVFPLLNFRFASETAYGSKEFEAIELIEPEDEQPVRVISVPKTQKTPRLIAIEPVCMQYTQQAVSAELIRCLESAPLTSGHINFTDQTINKRLALEASATLEYATIDLSAASDRVKNSLAMTMFDSRPLLRERIEACRTSRAELPDGSVLSLRKFASMGSALCFPVEAMYFYTICIVALMRNFNLPLTYYNVKKCCSKVYVYGDDIIVPNHTAEVVSVTLQKYLCKVNVTKSYWTGKFRESCGCDAYNGTQVTPVYVRQYAPRNKKSCDEITSWVATANLFAEKAYNRASTHMFNCVERIIGKLPNVAPTCAGLGKHTSYYDVERVDKNLQCPLVKTYVVKTVGVSDCLTGWNALTKCLLKLEKSANESLDKSVDRIKLANDIIKGKPSFSGSSYDDIKSIQALERDHLVKTSRRGSALLKRRWIRPY